MVALGLALLHGFAEKPKMLEDAVMMPLATHTGALESHSN